MKEQNALETELEYFQKNKQEYLKLYKDQFVLIKGENFAGSFTTEAEAYKAGLEKFGNAPFLIKQVLDDDGTVSYPAFFMVNSSIDKLAAYSYTSLLRADQLLFARLLLIGGIVAASVSTRPSMRVFHRLLNWHVGFSVWLP